jgi:hypothetical protein
LNGKDPTTDEERARVLDGAIDSITCTLSERYADRNLLNCVKVKCAVDMEALKYETFIIYPFILVISSEKLQWELFFNVKNYQLPAFKSKLKLYCLFVKHAVRLRNYILFLRCDDINCSHCKSLGPVRAPSLLNVLRQRGGFFTPIPSTTYSGTSRQDSLFIFLSRIN